MIRRKWYGLLRASACAGALILGGGCDSPTASSSDAEATVHGTVKVKGKLATSGQVSFSPANINRKGAATTKAEISKEGTYTVKTLAGGNLVTVTTPETAKDPMLQYNRVQYKAAAGDNTYDIDVTPP